MVFIHILYFDINYFLYFRSHCTCDDMLYDCLKQANSTSAQLMGTIYFNLVQVNIYFLFTADKTWCFTSIFQ